MLALPEHFMRTVSYRSTMPLFFDSINVVFLDRYFDVV
jgi:hypothetical protein